MVSHKNENYRGQIPISQLQREYFLHFNYNYWIHKANAILAFINDPSSVNKLRFQGDKDTEQTILDNLKMELHMMVFHSLDTLFLNVFSIVHMPELPWIWISRCDTTMLHTLIKTVRDHGLLALQQSPEIWLRENLLPCINENHENYEKSKLSSVFVVNYLNALSEEYIDHNEYNSYKHGLRSFVGRSRFQAFNDTTSEKNRCRR